MVPRHSAFINAGTELGHFHVGFAPPIRNFARLQTNDLASVAFAMAMPPSSNPSGQRRFGHGSPGRVGPVATGPVRWRLDSARALLHFVLRFSNFFVRRIFDAGELVSRVSGRENQLVELQLQSQRVTVLRSLDQKNH